MASRIPLLLMALTIPFFASCDTTAPPEVTGIYVLQRSNGEPLPFGYEDEFFLSEVTAGEITLYRDGNFVLQSTTRDTDKVRGAVESATDYLAGVYRLQDTALTLDFGREELPGTVEGRVLEIRGYREVWTFRR